MSPKLTYSLLFLLVLSPWLGAQQQAEPKFGTVKTIIKSDQLEMKNEESGNHFFFEGNVTITGNNLIATCDHMEVITLRQTSAEEGSEQAEPETPEESGLASDGELGSIDRIIATGNVIIRQSGRSATANKAIIIPSRDRVELHENVVITNPDGVLRGEKGVMEKGREAYIVGDAKNRTTLILSEGLQLEDMGAGDEPEPAPQSPESEPKPKLEDTDTDDDEEEDD